MNQKPITGAEIASVPCLQELEKQYRRSGWKWPIVLSIPAFWIMGAAVAYLVDETWMWEALVGWCLLVAFMAGVYLLYQVPAAADVVHKYSLEILPGLFRKLGAEQVRVARRHDLSMKVFLEAGLYYEKYSSISRQDCIQGMLHGTAFGMYQVAMQTDSSLYRGAAGSPGASLKTNQFYGWYIVVDAAPVNGFHFITTRRRINAGESDDWHKKTVSHWENDQALQRISSGNAAFDEAFLLNSDQPSVLLSMLSPELQEFFLHLEKTSANSFAISIQRSSVYLLIGHEKADLRIAPEKGFTNEIPQQLTDNVRWYINLMHGLRKLARR